MRSYKKVCATIIASLLVVTFSAIILPSNFDFLLASQGNVLNMVSSSEDEEAPVEVVAPADEITVDEVVIEEVEDIDAIVTADTDADVTVSTKTPVKANDEVTPSEEVTAPADETSEDEEVATEATVVEEEVIEDEEAATEEVVEEIDMGIIGEGAYSEGVLGEGVFEIGVFGESVELGPVEA